MSESTTSGYLLLLPGVTAELIDDRPGHIQLYKDQAPTPVVLSDGAYRVAEAFDGTATAADVFERLRRSGIPVPNVDFVAALAQLLKRHGLLEAHAEPLEEAYVRVLPREIESLYPLRHACTGCGRSCEGHYIGPLHDDFLNTVDALHARMAELYEDLVGVTPTEVVVSDGRERHVLTRRNGACIYLGADGLCRVHKHLGPEAKPLMCRLFPLDIVQTESGIRVGVVGRCYHLHESFESAPASTPSELTGLPMETFPSPEPRGADLRHRRRLLLNPRPDSVYAHTQRLEQLLVHVLQDEAFSLHTGFEAFHGTMRGQGLDPAVDDVMLDTAFGDRLVSMLRAFGQSMLEDLASDAVRSKTAHGGLVSDLCRFLVDLEVRPLIELGEAERRYVSFILSNEVFLRQWVNQPSLPTAFLAGLCGATVARWRAVAAGESGEERVGQAFAFSMVAWVRTVRSGDHFVRFIPSEEAFQSLIDALGTTR